MVINEIVIALFFLYFVLLSGVTNRVLNCDLQRLVRDHVFLNHMLLFFSVFIFAFILKWYGFAGLEPYSNMNSIIGHLPDKIQYLIKTLSYTIFIYFIFILSTKNSGNFMYFFIISLFIIICLQLFSKGMNPKLYNDLKNYNFIGLEEARKKLINDEDNYNNFDFHIILHNFLHVLYLVVFFSLILGASKYYIKQKKDFGKKI